MPIAPDAQRRAELRDVADRLRRTGELPARRLADGLDGVAARRPGRDAKRWSRTSRPNVPAWWPAMHR